MNVAAVVLAAGGSTRMGRPKALLRLGGTSLVRRAVAAAVEGGCARVLVVLGADAEHVATELAGSPAVAVLNPDWPEGLSSSIRRGIAELEGEPAIDAALLLACDQPRLDSLVVQRVLSASDTAPAGMVACRYGGTPGIPALFARKWFPDLLCLRGAGGAKPLLLRSAPRVTEVPWPDGAIDVDTPEQWRHVADDAD